MFYMCGEAIMRTIYLQLVLITLAVFSCLGTGATVAEEAGFRSIFDGKTLNGWKAANMSYWTVEDGAITARATKQNPVKKNQFLVWQWGQLDDFELKLKYRISGTAVANSGIQFRSRIEEDGIAIGYQADIDLGGRWAGALYDEHGRGLLAQRGQKTVINSAGKMTRTSIGDPDTLWANINKDGWNDYHIIARGGHMILKINGKVTAEVIDNDKKQQDLSGILALQLHSGPPLTVQFKDIRIKRLKLQDRKKIVLVAGPRSHSYGSHEHKAGYLLLAKRLNKNMHSIYAVVYTEGWPKDPTAFDNADAISFNCDGGAGHMIIPHLAQIDELAKKGVGLAFLHYALIVPKGQPGNYLFDWIGGYYETYWSVNPHWVADFKQLPDHPITRGVKPFAINDEWYYHMRFAKDMQGVTPILTAIPPDSTRKRKDGPHSGNPHVRAQMGMPEHVAWAYERPPRLLVEDKSGGGRGFGFTGAHWHWNWAHNDFRKLVLNALVWVSGAEVPPNGVSSKAPTLEELQANQDFPKPKNWNPEKIQQDIQRWNRPSAAGIVYRNPRVYNVDYSFELFPDPNKIDRTKDLKLWIPIPREWDSQKGVKIISVEPAPHSKYEDPEHGNRMLFWDFGKEPEKSSCKVDIKYRLESYEVHAEVDPNKIGPYDETSQEYALYTRSTHKICITPKIKEMAQEAVGDETNPYLQAAQIFRFVRNKVRYKMHRLERGVGTKALLNNPVYDEKTGEEHYEGECAQQAILFVAMCRSIGIPARTVNGFVGHRPWVEEDDLELFLPIELELSPDGLAGARHYLAGSPHAWTEFYIPRYDWIPADPTWGRFGRLNNEKIITDKGCDIRLGPNVPLTHSEGYGFQWVAINNGRAVSMLSGVWNIGKIRIAKVKLLHHSDPFPADAFAGYPASGYPETLTEERAAQYRKRILILIDDVTRGQPDKEATLAKAYKEKSRLRYQLEPFICHMLRKVVGDKKFSDIFKTYTNLRVKSGEPVSTVHFQKIAEDIYGKPLDWFFKQWIGYTELPHLKLDAVTLSKDEKGWCVRGDLRQLNSKLFRLPIEIALETEKTTEHKTIWLETRKADFEFTTPNRPKRIVVDPNNDILQIRKMPPLLNDFWKVYPNLVVVYGTTAEAEANKAAAENFNKEYLGLSDDKVKTDVDVNEADLKTKCIILFGRPETNKIAQKFENIFPIRFKGDKFTWQGTTYDQPTQGVAQIVDNPDNPGGLIILYAGLSPEATRGFCDLSSCYSATASYVIFDGDKELLRGDWKVDSDLYWNFDRSG